MEWSQDLAVGIDDIDEQHKELFRRINKLVESVRQSRCRETIPQVIEFLEEYVIVHFSEEEKYMKEHGYPGYEEHKALHSEFLESISGLKEELEKLRNKGGSSYELSVTTNQVVVEWIVAHIIKVDRELGGFLRARLTGGGHQ